MTLHIAGRWLGLASMWSALALLSVTAVGCRRATEGQDPTRDRVQKITGQFVFYTQKNKQPPKNLEEFKKHLEALPENQKKDLLEPSGAQSIDDFLTSPRDGKPFIIRYDAKVPVMSLEQPMGGASGELSPEEAAKKMPGAGMMMGGKPEVIVYEQTGKGGKRWIGFWMGMGPQAMEADENQAREYGLPPPAE